MNYRYLRLILALGAASVFGVGCGRSEQDYQAQVTRVRQLESELRTLTEARDNINRELEQLRASNTQMTERLRALGADVSTAQGERDAARRRVEELERMRQQAEARLATFRQMLGRFQAMITSGQLRVRIVRGRMVIELPAGILFDPGDARLRPQGQQVLASVAQVLTQIPDRDFLVAGHTDNQRLGRGSRFEDNWGLSAARASTVVRFLQEHQVPPQHLGAAGYGEFQPAAENDTEEHRALNRRVEIVLMPNINELPDLSSIEGDGSGNSGSSSTTPAPTPTPTPAPTPAP